MPRETTLSLYDDAGRRLYITENERDALIWASSWADPPRRLLVLVLIHTGCRISEALALRPAQIDVAGCAIVFRSLKKRGGKTVFRSVPVPRSLIVDLVRSFTLDPHGGDQARLWPVTRNTGYRWVKAVMIAAKIPPGPHQSPKGLRHGYGVRGILSGVAVSELQVLMGHEDIATTSGYLRVVGPEKRAVASRMWRSPPLRWRRWLPPLMLMVGLADWRRRIKRFVRDGKHDDD